jgi:predicted MPP superfamily phosphohydrolase
MPLTNPLPRLRAALRFARGLRRGVARGDFFPDRGTPPMPAPGGSEAPPPPGPRNEAGRFVTLRHALGPSALPTSVSVLHLTDLHVRGPGPWLDALCAALRAAPPADLLCLTGDLVTRGWTAPAVDQLLAALPPARLGRFAVMGNWEHWAGLRPPGWGDRLAAAGVQLLHNRWVDVGPLIVAGTDDHLAGAADPVAALAGRPPGKPTVTLTHSPAFFDQLRGPDLLLTLAGHSHAGQVRAPVLGALWAPMGTGRYVAGWYRQGDHHLHVGRGLGWSIAPVRWGCPPELSWIRLGPAGSEAPAHVDVG